MAHHARPRHAEGVAHGDGATVHVHAVVGDAQALRCVQGHDGEGLVELPQPHVVDGEAMAAKEPRHGKDGSDAHLLRCAASDGEALEGPEGLEAAPGRLRLGHDHHRRGAVGELARVARGDGGALRLAHWLEAGDRLEGSARAVALVAGHGVGHAVLGARGLVLDNHLNIHGHDLRIEATRLLRCRRSTLRLYSICVLRFARYAVPLRDEIRGVDHGHPELGARFGEGRFHLRGLLNHGLHQADGLHPARDHDGAPLMDDGVRAVRDRLEA
mmetsp:Transcript_578/g.1628  ORF Transcript_578/g.1628 Transcript_578/m.1628 type:complete len:271 (-) Transcript_578:352-1164(-)